MEDEQKCQNRSKLEPFWRVQFLPTNHGGWHGNDGR
jgi:hypothetical protein